ncbi:MAG: YARHG domain-containing protein, partial [Prevotellaceae bacterium]|nr:YARHG domain-containing protein [Prevotellaceae bacterium]
NYDEEVVYSFSYYDWKNRKLVANIPVLDTMQFEIFINKDGKKYRKNSIQDIDHAYTDITRKYTNLELYWVDSNFNLIQPTLMSYYNSNSSFNIGTNNPYYYRSSVIEGKKNDQGVWVACKFTLPFDKALYDIYHNTLLEKSVVEKFDEWELRMLRNMVFAKHSYQFQSKYLQAFFNLFNFYYGKKHLADVNDLLTPIDKKNLELIQQVNKNKK